MVEIRFTSYNNGIFSMRSSLLLIIIIQACYGKKLIEKLIVHIKHWLKKECR